MVATAATAAKLLQSCPTLCDPIGGSPAGSAVPGTLQARTLEWVAISFSNAWRWKVKVKSLSRVWLFATPWTAAYQAPPSMGFSRQEDWSRLPLPSPMGATSLYRKEGSLFFFFSEPFILGAIKSIAERESQGTVRAGGLEIADQVLEVGSPANLGCWGHSPWSLQLGNIW